MTPSLIEAQWGRYKDMQTKRVTHGNTVRDTQSDVTEIRKQTDNNKGAHSLIHTHKHTHPPTQKQTDGHTETWLRNRHTQYHRFLLTISESLIHAYLCFLFFLFLFIENRYVLMRRIKRAQSIYLFYLYYTFLTRKQHNKLFLFLFFFESFPFFLFFFLLRKFNWYF